MDWPSDFYPIISFYCLRPIHSLSIHPWSSTSREIQAAESKYEVRKEPQATQRWICSNRRLRGCDLFRQSELQQQLVDLPAMAAPVTNLQGSRWRRGATGEAELHWGRAASPLVEPWKLGARRLLQDAIGLAAGSGGYWFFSFFLLGSGSTGEG